ncbi:MAG: signal peptidase II [Spirochaetaceae bacterium]|nr:signal peptidase II [Spirochaetaceae bacterium]
MSRSLTLSLSAFLVIADQISKKLIIDHIAVNTLGYSFLNDFLWIVHVKNLGIAFSLGDSVPNIIRIILFIIIPFIVMSGLGVYIVRTEGLSLFQRWCMAGILGGGLGNLIDRIFRPEGVVDFISVKFYGLLGMERFPVFNVADSSIVIFGILLLITFIVEGRKKNEQKA